MKVLFKISISKSDSLPILQSTTYSNTYAQPLKEFRTISIKRTSHIVVHEGRKPHWWMNRLGRTGGWVATTLLTELCESRRRPYLEALQPQGGDYSPHPILPFLGLYNF